jgi:hypothetical protein
VLIVWWTIGLSAFSLGSAVYIRNKDHALFRNLEQPIEEAIERETIGWLSKETDEILLVEHDRTMPNLQVASGQCNGLIILKSCILEIQPILLQESFKWLLNSQNAKGKGEFALQPKKRKTPKNGTGATI